MAGDRNSSCRASRVANWRFEANSDFMAPQGSLAIPVFSIPVRLTFFRKRSETPFPWPKRVDTLLDGGVGCSAYLFRTSSRTFRASIAHQKGLEVSCRESVE